MSANFESQDPLDQLVIEYDTSEMEDYQLRLNQAKEIFNDRLFSAAQQIAAGGVRKVLGNMRLKKIMKNANESGCVVLNSSINGRMLALSTYPFCEHLVFSLN